MAKKYDVIAITACPTGIAHTFMAAQAIENSAKAMGYTVKVETQGTEGSQNTLTAEEIKDAKAIILAVDRNIDMERFDGEKVLQTSTSKVIKNADVEIEKAMQNKGTKVIKSGGNGSSASVAGDGQLTFENFGGRIWKSVMTGVSFMLPFVVFGGILIALSFLIDINNAGASNFGSGNDVALWFNTAGGMAMGMMVPILGAYVTYGMVGKVGLLPGFLVGLMARGDFTSALTPAGTTPWYAPVDGVSSGFIGAILGAILAAAIVILVWKMLSKLPQQLNGIKTILLMPLITGLVVVAVFWVANIPFIYMSWGLQLFLGLFDGSPATAWILGLIIGLMMAIDMGGPINKAAYVVGVTSISTSLAAGDPGSMTMAMVMAAGMVPPLSIALATATKKKYYDSDDIEAGYSNWILGASFITEGAIPFAAKYPKQIMPGILAGSAVAGMLVGIFQITLAAPHGGILVFALVSTTMGTMTGGAAIGYGIVMYLVAIIAGTVVGAVIINILMGREYAKGRLPVQTQGAKVPGTAAKPATAAAGISKVSKATENKKPSVAKTTKKAPASKQ